MKEGGLKVWTKSLVRRDGKRGITREQGGLLETARVDGLRVAAAGSSMAMSLPFIQCHARMGCGACRGGYAGLLHHLAVFLCKF